MAIKVPTTIVTGFLGSGKTTIIGHLIEELQAKNLQVIYIKNEIGDQDIDGQLMKSKHVIARELLNGCICCTLVGPFVSAMTEVVETYAPDRIIVEASGTADPAALALMVAGHPLLSRDAVISIIDVVNFDGYEDLTITAQQQTKLTDLIVFNKVELVDQARKKAVVGYVRELNNHSPIIEAPKGRLSSELVFGATTAELPSLLLAATTDHDNHPADHLHQDQLEGFSVQLTQPLDTSKLENWLETLPANIFRTKGFILTPDKQFWLVNRVGHRTTIEPAPQIDQSEFGILLFIGFQAKQLETELTTQLRKLS